MQPFIKAAQRRAALIQDETYTTMTPSVRVTIKKLNKQHLFTTNKLDIIAYILWKLSRSFLSSAYSVLREKKLFMSLYDHKGLKLQVDVGLVCQHQGLQAK